MDQSPSPDLNDVSDASDGSAGGGYFKTREVVDLLDLSRRQLQYWAKTGLIVPSARTPGGHHRYSFQDLVALKATKRLIDEGVSVQKIRRSVHRLQQLFPHIGRPLGELVLVATGDVVLVFQDGTVFEAISGQEWVFPVAEFEREVRAYRAANHGAKGVRAKTGSGPNAGVEGISPERPGPNRVRSRARKAEKDWSRVG